MLKIGIVGLPNVGKSTLFNALLKKQVAQSANYPFTTIEPNVGVVEVPDEKLEVLKKVIDGSEGLSPSFKIIGAVVQFVDIAGLVKGAHKGEGLGNKFLSHIKEVDAIVFVVRDFKSGNILETGIDPDSDLEVLKSELLLKDLETIEKRIDSLSRELKTTPLTDPKHLQIAVLKKSYELVSQGKWLEEVLNIEDLEKISELQLLSCKKYIIVVNSDETDLKKPVPVAGGLRICAKMEEELVGLSAGEQKEYLDEIGISQPGLNILITKAYEILGLVSFYTAGAKEVRAWTIKKGSIAPVAAGVIHSDFQRGFIAADIVTYDNFVKINGWKNARENGLVKTIGKSEIMPSDSIVEFKFSV